MAMVHVLQTGFTRVSPAVPDRSARRWRLAYTGLFQGRRRRILVPVKAFLIETGGRRILVDAGWSAECTRHPVRHMGPLLFMASVPVLRAEESLSAQLSRLGIAPEDIDAVILTHLDCDHASGLCDVRGAKRFFASAEEIAAAKKRNARYRPQFWRGILLEPIPFADDPAAPYGRSCDLFGDGSVRAVLAPGHSAGSVCIIVQGESGLAVFSGDNARSWEELRLPGPTSNDADMEKSLRWIQGCARGGARIFAAHDSAVPQGDYKL